MDRRTAVERQQQGLQTIKAHMPQTYAEIKRLADARGGEVYRLVRQGCGGQPGCFYAVEAGHVVGTPFGADQIDPIVAQSIVQFGASFLMLIDTGERNGAN